MLRQAGCLLTVLALFQVAGGHWIVMQSAAWAGMLVTYTQKYGLSEGIDKTFDGAHPCGLCKVVKQGRDQEEKQPLPADALKKKTEPFSLAECRPLPPPLPSRLKFPPSANESAASRHEAPPKPVPIARGHLVG